MSASERANRVGAILIVFVAIIIALSQFLSSRQEAAKEKRIKELEKAVLMNKE